MCFPCSPSSSSKNESLNSPLVPSETVAGQKPISLKGLLLSFPQLDGHYPRDSSFVKVISNIWYSFSHNGPMIPLYQLMLCICHIILSFFLWLKGQLFFFNLFLSSLYGFKSLSMPVATLLLWHTNIAVDIYWKLVTCQAVRWVNLWVISFNPLPILYVRYTIIFTYGEAIEAYVN